MKKINELANKYREQILKIKNVIGVGCGYKEVQGRTTDEKSLMILVKEKLQEEDLNQHHVVPEQIEEVCTDVIEIGDIELLGSRTTQGRKSRTEIESRTTRFRPVQPGISIGHYKISAGTFGAVVKDKRTEELLILSNNHVLANLTSGYDGRAEIGDPILQPGRHDGGEQNRDIVGHLERFSGLKKKNTTSSCLIAQGVENIMNGFSELIQFPYQVKFLRKNGGENLVDCAVAKPVAPGRIEDEILEIGKVRGVTEPEVGMRIVKSGRTSGVTRSKIRAINATVEVNVTATEKAIFNEQIVATPFSKPGDSGSLVLDKNNRAVGLLFAGSNKSTICNQITNVIEELEIEFV